MTCLGHNWTLLFPPLQGGLCLAWSKAVKSKTCKLSANTSRCHKKEWGVDVFCPVGHNWYHKGTGVPWQLEHLIRCYLQVIQMQSKTSNWSWSKCSMCANGRVRGLQPSFILYRIPQWIEIFFSITWHVICTNIIYICINLLAMGIIYPYIAWTHVCLCGKGGRELLQNFNKICLHLHKVAYKFKHTFSE